MFEGARRGRFAHPEDPEPPSGAVGRNPWKVNVSPSPSADRREQRAETQPLQRQAAETRAAERLGQTADRPRRIDREPKTRPPFRCPLARRT